MSFAGFYTEWTTNKGNSFTFKFYYRIKHNYINTPKKNYLVNKKINTMLKLK